MSGELPPHPDPEVDAATPPCPPGWRGPAWAFHEHPSRQVEPEVDFGYQWRRRSWPMVGHRVSWNPTTGELYAEEMRPGHDAGVLVVSILLDLELVRALVDRARQALPADEGWHDLDVLVDLGGQMTGWRVGR